MESNSNQQMYNSALLGILQNEGKIEPFLDVIFGFLYSCTDFYRILRSPADKVGFPPGVSQKAVQSAFKKYEQLAEEAEKKKYLAQRNVCSEQGDSIPRAAKIVEIEDTNDKLSEVKDTKSSVDLCPQPSKTDLSEPKAEDDSEELDETAKQLKQEQRTYQSQSDSYNGADRGNYSWSQNIQELDVFVKVSKQITKGKLVKVVIGHTHLFVSTLENGTQTTIVDGDLNFKINVENSCWTLRPGEAVHINLEKVQERWWDALLTDEPKINIRNIDASRPMTDLGEDEQAKIQELMFNEQQKRLGKATSDQMKIESILKDAWDKEGSPFKGQPFDPSVVNMSSSGDMIFNQK